MILVCADNLNGDVRGGAAMEDLLQIRYSRLCFTLEFPEETHLPVHKVSMLRGGIGEMLLQGNCIGNRDCEKCSFAEECVVQQIYYHKLKIVPDYVQKKESLGYVYECGDTRTNYHKGDTLRFRMTLFGNVIVHFPAVLQAVYWLGMHGVGKEKARFRLIEIENQHGDKVLNRDEVCLAYLRPEMIGEYAAERMNRGRQVVKMRFVSPLTLKHEGRFLKEFQEQALVYSIYRRIYLLNCMEGNVMERKCPFQGAFEITDQRVRPVKIPRYSGTHDRVICLEGIEGEMEIRAEETFVPLLYAGELTHIGKNTSMGFGQYVVG
jgi:CRISPR-associated endoribonuclease Cas6